MEMKQEAGVVHGWVVLPTTTRPVCPGCSAAAPIPGHRDRTCRHPDTYQFKTLVRARVPLLDRPTHGIRQLRMQWAEPRSRFTALFEAAAIDWSKRASAVAKPPRFIRDEGDGIMGRAVRRGLARRRLEPPRFVGVHGTLLQKRCECVTVAVDLARDRVAHVADDRSQASLDEFWKGLSSEPRAASQGVALDEWECYIRSTREDPADAEHSIVFDEFHVAQHLNQAVDEVQRREHRERLAEGDPPSRAPSTSDCAARRDAAGRRRVRSICCARP